MPSSVASRSRAARAGPSPTIVKRAATLAVLQLPDRMDGQVDALPFQQPPGVEQSQFGLGWFALLARPRQVIPAQPDPQLHRAFFLEVGGISRNDSGVARKILSAWRKLDRMIGSA